MEYTVTLRNTFEADTPEDAVREMVAWVLDTAHAAGYHVEWESGDDRDGRGSGVAELFIDADDLEV